MTGVFAAKLRLPDTRPVFNRLAQPGAILALFLTLGYICLAALFGLAVPIFGPLVPAIVGAIALGILTLALAPVTIVWMMLILVLLVVGQFTFFLGINKALWLPYFLLLLILVKFAMEQFHPAPATRRQPGWSSLAICMVLFILCFLMAAMANGTDIASAAVAAKNYIFPWFLTALVATAVRDTKDFRRLWLFLLGVVFVQLPLAIPQHFHYAKLNRETNLDAVVGSFGGNMNFGGASGAMATFLVFGILLAAALYRRRQISLTLLTAVVLTALATVALAEVKIFFLALPLGLAFMFRQQLLRNPAKTLLIGIVGAGLLAALLTSYQYTTSDRLGKARTLDGYLEHALATESDPYYYNPITRELSRAGAILTWARYNQLSDPHFYLGHGPAASRHSQTLGVGVAARKYPFTLTTSSASTILWDIGIAGLALFLAMLLAAATTALRLAPAAPPMERAALESIGTMLLLALPLSFYNRDLIDTPAIQTLLAFWIGYILLCRRNLAAGRWSITATAPTKEKA